MWCNPKLFHRVKSIDKNFKKRYILTRSIEKSMKKKYLKKINIDTINSEKFFDRSGDHK